MALGLSSQPSTASERDLAIRWINEGRSWLMVPSEKSHMTINGLQILCLLNMARMVYGISADLAWVSAGSLMRIAMYMGLHRDPSGLKKMTIYEAEMRRRLWMTILELNLLCAFEAGGMPLISCEDYDTLPPADLNDDSLDGSIDDPSKRAISGNTATQMSTALALFKSFPTRLKLLHSINDFRSKFDYGETLRLNSELEDACRLFAQKIGSLTEHGIATSTAGGPKHAAVINTFHVSIAEVILYRCFHVLHWPVIVTAFQDRKYYFSRKTCHDSAIKIAKMWKFIGLQDHGPGVRRSDFQQLVANGSGMFKNLPVQAFCVIALEVIDSKNGCFGGLDDLSIHGGREALRSCLDKALEWSLCRLRAGELAGKAHCFFSACIARIDGLDRNLDQAAVARLITQRATEVAQTALSILTSVASEHGVMHSQVLTDRVGIGSNTAPVTLDSLESNDNWLWDESDGVIFDYI